MRAESTTASSPDRPDMVARHPSLHWINIVLANIKTAIVVAYKAVDYKHLVRALAEFKCRVNNRENVAAMISIFACAATRSNPVTYADLEWADYGGRRIIQILVFKQPLAGASGRVLNARTIELTPGTVTECLRPFANRRIV